MKIKDENGKVIADIAFEDGASIKDLIKSLSNKNSKSSFQNLISIEESQDKKQIVFNFENGKIFYDLPNKIFVKENGVKIGANSFKNIKPNLDNKNYKLRYDPGYVYERNDFWIKLISKVKTPWIKTFFTLVEIWANKKPKYLNSREINKRNKLDRLIEDKEFFNCLESFSKISVFQSLDESALVKFYDSMVGTTKDESKNRFYVNFKESGVDDWFISNFDKTPSEVYFKDDNSELISHIAEYIHCYKAGIKELFKYVFEQHRGIILKGQIKKIKELISFGYEPKRLMDYLYRDIYNQGLELNLDSKWSHDFGALTILYDYAQMNIEMKKDYEKYPRYLCTFHDITQKNYKLEEDKILNEKFKNRIKQLKSNKFEYSDGVHQIIIPKGAKDLIEEGQSLCHCVSSYYKRMATGETNIVFLRYKNKVNQSLVTLEIDNNNLIVQAKSKANAMPQEKEKEFVKKYQGYLKCLKTSP